MYLIQKWTRYCYIWYSHTTIIMNIYMYVAALYANLVNLMLHFYILF